MACSLIEIKLTISKKEFLAGLTVFLNGWLHVTASEAVRCLTDLAKCKKVCFIDSVVD